MSSCKARRCIVLFVGLMVAAALALAKTPGAAAAPSRRLAHPVLVGVGATWTERGVYQGALHPGAMLAFELALNRYAAIGLLGDITYIEDRLYGRRYRLLTGPDLKLILVPNGIVRPWVTVGAAASFLDDQGLGLGMGAGAFFLPNTPMTFFVDVRRYHLGNWEGPGLKQIMLRAGMAF